MGLGDRLNKILNGVEDIVSAPVGFVWDMAQVPFREDLSFGDPFGTGLTELSTGLANVSEGTGLSTFARGVASKTPLDEALGAIIREGELLYNQEYQRELGQTPFGISDLPFTDRTLDPGDVSIARGTSTALQGLAELPIRVAPGGKSPAGFQEMWRRSNFTSPGQSFVASAWGLWELPEQEREEALSSLGFQVISTVIDAVSRWYTQPEVLAGKGVKVARARYTPSVNRRISLFQKKFGMDAAERKPPTGDRLTKETLAKGEQPVLERVATGELLADERPKSLTLRPQVETAAPAADMVITGSRGKHLYTVVRSSELRDSFRDRAVVMMASEEDAARYASELWRANPEDLPLIIKIDPEDMPIMLDDITRPFTQGSDGFVDDAALLGFTDDLEQHSVGVAFPPEADLDPASFRYIMDPGSMPDHLRPAGTLDQALYTPEGKAIEPRDLYRSTEVEQTILGARSIYNDFGETEAVKFIQARQAQAGRQGPSLQDYIFGEKRVQAALNDMEGKSATYIRRVYFKDVSGGGTLSTLLAEATSYKQRVAILGAAMGIQIPEAITIGPIAQARLKILTKEMDDLQRGPEIAYRQKTVYRSMTDLEDWDLNPAKTDELLQAVRGEIDEAVDQALMGDFLDTARHQAILDKPPRLSALRKGKESFRSSWLYQQTPLARPIRSVVEKRPHRFLNVNDPQGDLQIVRQLEEAKPLGISSGRVNDYQTKWMGATSEVEKVRLAHQMDDEIITAALTRAGLSKKEFNQVLSQVRRGKRRTGEMLQSRRYSPVDGGDIISYVDDSGELVEMVLPVLSTQMQNWIPLTDVRELIRISTAIGRMKAKWGVIPSYAMDSFYHLWKPSVLLRGGWPLRVVSDEQLRILARTGGLMAHLQAIELGEMPKWTGFVAGQTAAGKVAATFSLPITTLTAGAARATSAVARGARKLRLTDPKLYDDMSSVGTENMVSSRAAFNGPNASVNQEMEMLIGRTESGILDNLVSKGTGEWSSVAQGSRRYSPAWQRALQDQIGRDPMSRIILETVLEGGTSAEGKRKLLLWLKGTPEGRELAEAMRFRSVNSERWVDDIEDIVSHYTVDYDQSLVEGALRGKVTAQMLERIDEARRPPVVHGEIIDQALGTSVVNETMTNFFATSYDLFGRLPTDTLSRQPMYKEIFGLEMRRIRNTLRKQGVDVESEVVIRRMGQTAKNNAREEVMTILYNLAEVSRFGHMMRWWIPFFPAWQEVLEVWTKLAIQDPSIPGRGLLLWNAPNRAGLISKDDEGNEFIQLRLSEKMSDKLGLTGFAEYLAEGGIRFGKSSFNMVTNSPLPSVGPPIQIPLNDVVRNKPELEEALRFLLPYGVEADATEIIFSPVVKRLGAWLTGRKSNDVYIRHFNNVLTWMDFQYRAGLRTDPVDLEEAYQITDKIFTVQTIANLTFPAQPIFDSPLKPYIDIYRDLQETMGSEADELFLREFGDEFISMTLSRTVSETGIPPTVEAQVARRQVEGLISDHPGLGRFIIGEDAAIGEFSTAAFAWQLSNPPTDDPAFREEAERRYRILTLDPDTGQIEEADTRLGWTEYIKAMDLIDLEMRGRGLTSLRVKAAEDLAVLKRALTAAVAEQYPSWWRDFNERDDLKWEERIKSFRAISSSILETDPERTDMTGVQEYIGARDIVLNELNRRKQLGGSVSLTAVSNQDLLMFWESIVFQITAENIHFKPIWHRYLEGDPVR